MEVKSGLCPSDAPLVRSSDQGDTGPKSGSRKFGIQPSYADGSRNVDPVIKWFN